jgi:ankyrin repeat protein
MNEARRDILDACDSNGNTPLIVASKYGQLQIVLALLAKNASGATLNVTRDSALITAGAAGHFDVVEALLEAGTSAFIQAANRDTLLICCKIRGSRYH